MPRPMPTTRPTDDRTITMDDGGGWNALLNANRSRPQPSTQPATQPSTQPATQPTDELRRTLEQFSLSDIVKELQTLYPEISIDTGGTATVEPGESEGGMGGMMGGGMEGARPNIRPARRPTMME